MKDIKFMYSNYSNSVLTGRVALSEWFCVRALVICAASLPRSLVRHSYSKQQTTIENAVYSLYYFAEK